MCVFYVFDDYDSYTKNARNIMQNRVYAVYIQDRRLSTMTNALLQIHRGSSKSNKSVSFFAGNIQRKEIPL